MTDFTQLSDKELSEAIDFHRRQRNMSRGVNEAMHMRQVQTVRLLEAEEARRLDEAQVKKPTKSEREIAYTDGSKNTSANMSVNKLAYALDKEPKKKVSLPKAPWNEEAEQIDELKKSTLASYVKKASTDQYLKGQAVQYHTNKAQTADGVFAKQSKEKHYDAADKALKKASNRDTGIGRAVDRLAKEEAEKQLFMDPDDKMWKVSYDHGPHQSNTIKVKAKSQSHAWEVAKEVAKRKYGHARITSGSVESMKEEVELTEAETNYVIKHKKTKQVLNTHSDYNTAKDEHEGLGDEKSEYGIYKQTKKDAALRNRNTYREEVEQIDEISASTLQSYVGKARDSKKAEMKNHTAAKNDMKKYGMAMDKKAHDDAARKVVNRGTGISVANKKLNTYPTDKAKAKVMAREEVELDESDNIRDLFAQSVQAKLKKAKVSYRDPNAKTAREEDRIAKQLAAKAKLKKEEVELDEETKYVVKGKSPFYKQDHFINTHETPKAQLIKKNIKHATRMDLETAKKVAKDWESHPNKYKTEVVPVNEAFEQIDEASYRDSGYANMLKASRKADKEADKMRAKHEKEAKKAGEPKAEFKEEADLRITKVYNKWPKKATYAVHTPDRKYFKEFDSMEAAKAHHAEKSGK